MFRGQRAHCRAPCCETGTPVRATGQHAHKGAGLYRPSKLGLYLGPSTRRNSTPRNVYRAQRHARAGRGSACARAAHAFRYIDCHIPNRTQPGHCTRAAHHHRTGDSRMVSRLVRLVVIVHVLKVQNARLMHARRTRASARVASLPPPPPHARPVIQPVGRRRAPHHPCRWLARCRRRCADSG